MDDRPLATLDYANPSVGQPLGSLFTVEWLPGGVKLTRPVRPSWAGAVSLFVVGGATLLMALACAAGVTDGPRYHRAAEWGAIVSLLAALLAVACVCFSVAWRLCRCQTLTVTLRGQELTIVNGVLTLRGRPWQARRVHRFSVSVGQPELPTFRIVALLRVSVSYGYERKLMYALPRDECVWAARLLNDVLASRPTA